ncbi:HIT-type domain-containing protein [Citrus sinensis]|nr:HIT-type domain-containing protein [Citrus sinensis]
MGPPARLCQVCNEAQSKYKCPNCFTPYCSLVCFKNHKVFPESPVERSLNADEPSQVLQKEQLESIASSSEIRDALQDESLQKLILGIDSSSNPEIELDKAMEVEAFRTFTDKILASISP